MLRVKAEGRGWRILAASLAAALITVAAIVGTSLPGALELLPPLRACIGARRQSAPCQSRRHMHMV